MKKTILTAALTALTCAAFAAELNINGSFTEAAPKNPNDKEILTAQFPKGWGGAKIAMLSNGGKNAVKVEGGYLMRWIGLGNSPDKQTFSGELKVKGTGWIESWFSGCSRKPGDPKPFGHEIRRQLIKTNLNGQDQVLKFSVEIGPYEQGYIYVSAKDAVVESVKANLDPIKK